MIDEFYSANDEDFDYSHPAEAAQAIWENDFDGEYSVGSTCTIHAHEFTKANASDFLPCIAEYLGESSLDQFGDRALDWSITGEAVKQLQGIMAETLDRWCEENNERPGLWHPIGNSREIRMRFTDENGGSESVEEIARAPTGLSHPPDPV